MKNKLTALLAALLLSISLLHTEVYASPNPDANNPLAISANVKSEFDVKSMELTSEKKFVSKGGMIPYPTDPDNWSN